MGLCVRDTVAARRIKPFLVAVMLAISSAVVWFGSQDIEAMAGKRKQPTRIKSPQPVAAACIVRKIGIYPLCKTHIYNVHCFNPYNAGDVNSAPMLSWDELTFQLRSGPSAQATILNIDSLGKEPYGGDHWLDCGPIPDGVPVIVGGGGLLAHGIFEEAMRLLAAGRPDKGPIIFWGIGLNGYAEKDLEAQRPVFPNYFKQATSRGHVLAGVRDYDPLGDFRWLPCASCLHQAFDRPACEQKLLAQAQTLDPKSKERIGVLTSTVPEGNQVASYLETWIEKGLLSRADVHSNNGTDLGPIVDFLKSYDLIVTSSYHATYWATLLGKKVVVCQPWSSKFRWMKHPPTIHSGDLLADVARADRFPMALNESRAANCFGQSLFGALQGVRAFRSAGLGRWYGKNHSIVTGDFRYVILGLKWLISAVRCKPLVNESACSGSWQGKHSNQQVKWWIGATQIPASFDHVRVLAPEECRLLMMGHLVAHFPELRSGADCPARLVPSLDALGGEETQGACCDSSSEREGSEVSPTPRHFRNSTGGVSRCSMASSEASDNPAFQLPAWLASASSPQHRRRVSFDRCDSDSGLSDVSPVGPSPKPFS
ncbi:unnamed protein product [Polarella glacialis]|uniref:Polysaccharide pyruvyl transferase domain-containing protein n=1 Tax=Polarella glacialis TaxID=89957 RepID=A0A813IXG3_POLGL|nr:unnamed protein product [Polarella glacialis]